MENDLFNFNSFRSRHQSMREFVAKHGEKKACGGNNSKDPGGCGRQRWEEDVPKLHCVAPQITRNQPNAERNNSKPAIVYAYRDAIDARNLKLPVENLSNTHSRLKKW